MTISSAVGSHGQRMTVTTVGIVNSEAVNPVSATRTGAPTTRATACRASTASSTTRPTASRSLNRTMASPGLRLDAAPRLMRARPSGATSCTRPCRPIGQVKVRGSYVQVTVWPSRKNTLARPISVFHVGLNR